MRRIISYQPTLGETALLILDELITATLGTFYPHPYYHAFCGHTQQRSFSAALKRLERKYLVGVKRKGRREEWHLTPEGEKLVGRLKLRLALARQKRWDGKWRLVIFDIPERIRDRRNFLRCELEMLGFHQLQKSVWVTPHSLPQGFDAIAAELGLNKHFRVVIAEAIQGDHDLREFFFPPDE